MTEEEYYARIKAEYEASTDAKLVEWARPYFEGTKKPNSKDRYVICPVSDKAADEIKQRTGSDVHGFVHAIRCDIIKHVYKRHGEHGEHDNTISDINDLGRIGYVLNKFDKILLDGGVTPGFLNRNNEPSTVIKFVKRIDGHVYSAEAVTDAPKKKTLYILSMYKDQTHKKESRLLTDNKDPELHVQNAPDSSISILPQPEKNVNSLEEKSFDPPDRQAKRRLTADDGRAKIAAEIAEIKAELRGKSPSEIAEMSRQARQKNKQNGNNANDNSCKSSSGNGSGGCSGR